MFSVCLCARFQVDLKEVHLGVVQRIFKYTLSELPTSASTTKLEKKCSLQGFYDADYAKDKVQ